MKNFIFIFLTSLSVCSIALADVVVREKSDPITGPKMVITKTPDQLILFSECNLQPNQSPSCLPMFNGQKFTAEQVELAIRKYPKHLNGESTTLYGLGGAAGGWFSVMFTAVGVSFFNSEAADKIATLGIEGKSAVAIPLTGAAAAMVYFGNKDHENDQTELRVLSSADVDALNADILVDHVMNVIDDTQAAMNSLNQK